MSKLNDVRLFLNSDFSIIRLTKIVVVRDLNIGIIKVILVIRLSFSGRLLHGERDFALRRAVLIHCEHIGYPGRSVSGKGN